MPGWKYTLAGRTQPAGNLEKRLVKIPINTNGAQLVVHIFYRPPFWKSGFMLSGSGFLGLLSLVFLEPAARKRRILKKSKR